jgi:hypothetical protein
VGHYQVDDQCPAHTWRPPIPTLPGLKMWAPPLCCPGAAAGTLRSPASTGVAVPSLEPSCRPAPLSHVVPDQWSGWPPPSSSLAVFTAGVIGGPGRTRRPSGAGRFVDAGDRLWLEPGQPRHAPASVGRPAGVRAPGGRAARVRTICLGLLRTLRLVQVRGLARITRTPDVRPRLEPVPGACGTSTSRTHCAGRSR